MKQHPSQSLAPLNNTTPRASNEKRKVRKTKDPGKERGYLHGAQLGQIFLSLLFRSKLINHSTNHTINT
jgi:hypothetical protein